MYATRDIVHSIVAVEWVVLVNCTDVGCTGLLGPEIKGQTMADNYAANVHFKRFMLTIYYYIGCC